MTFTVANTALTNTYDYWRQRTNELAFAMSTAAVTTDSNTAVGNAAITGAFTANAIFVGNSTVNVQISSSVLAANAVNANYSTVATTFTVGNSSVNTTANSTSIKVINNVTVGNSTANVIVNGTAVSLANSTANISYTIPPSAAIAAGNYFLNANGQWVQVLSAVTPITTGAVSTAGTSQQVVDAYTMSGTKGAEYFVHVKATSSNGYTSAKILTMHNTTSAFSTEWATMNSNGSLGVFNTFTNTTHVVLSFTPAVTATTVTFSRIAL